MLRPAGDRGRHADYGVAYRNHNVPPALPAGAERVVWLQIENTGRKTWVRQHPAGRRMELVVYLDGVVERMMPLPAESVETGARVTVTFTLVAPDDEGGHRLGIDLVEQQVAYFADQGVARLEVPFRTFRAEPSAGEALADDAIAHNSWFYWPAQGVRWSASGGRYPIFAQHAAGCCITDVDGRRYLDSALLGYAHPEVQEAIRQTLGCAGLTTLPHGLEMEVTRMVCAEVPCAEMVVFGKNGSDVCTAAARLARAVTGRRLILVCGYHGWQDWYLQRADYQVAGLAADKESVLPFRFNDAGSVTELFDRYPGRIAAVMLEPAAPIGGVNGPVPDADAGFLAAVADMTRRAGALLVFDEILTGFRYRGGSVQRALGVLPDLACFGKALAGGMPLSVLAGRREVFRKGMERIFYGPTFKGEVYSFAAAQAALKLYRTVDVPGHVWAFGERLRGGVHELARSSGVPLELVGPPFRMLLTFQEPDIERLVLMRTLLLQELLKAGVLTYRGVMLPSLAHDESALAETLVAFERALGVLADAVRGDSFARYLEIPPIV